MARLNLRVSIEELVRRLDDIQLEEGTTVHYHSSYNRHPVTVPIRFTAVLP